MSTRTAFLARLIGIYCLIAGLVMAVRGRQTVALVDALLHDAPLVFILGVAVLVAGLAIVLAHNNWSGGLLPVVVTLIGWATLLKGLAFLALSPATLGAFYGGQLHYAQLYYLFAAIPILIGLYLTIGGFRTAPP